MSWKFVGGWAGRRQALDRIVLAMALAAIPMPAQTFFGSVVGTVLDSQGAPIPGAGVTLTNTGTLDRRSAATDNAGNYQFVELAPGTYQVDIEKSGFKHFRRDGIQVTVQGAIRIDGKIEVGDVSDVVVVSAQSPLLETESGSLSHVVQGRQVEDMPLNGRNVMNLLALVPGVVPDGSFLGSSAGNQLNGQFTNNFGWANIQIGGALAGTSAFLLDGVSLNTPWEGTIGIIPAQDSVQEFRIATNSVDAEFGGFLGGVVNINTKSGGNALHGSLYEYIRNRVLNANYFFNNRTGVPRPSFVQNQYGADLAGPVVRNKTFFFFGWENFSVRQGIPLDTTVPALAMRPDINNTHTGDFTGLPTIYDPYTSPRTPFPGNIIPASRIDPTAHALLKLWGLPNSNSPSGNFAANVTTGSDRQEYTGRLDHNLSDKQRLFARYLYWNGYTQPYNPFANAAANASTIYNAHQAVLGDTYTVNPSTVVDVRLTYMRNYYSLHAPSYGTDLSQFGAAWAALAQEESYTVNPLPSVSGYYPFTYMDAENLAITNEYGLSGSLTKIEGRHTLKFGGEARRDEFSYSILSNAGGLFAFNNGFTSANGTTSSPTGNAFASFLLGTPSAGNIGTTTQTGQFLGERAVFASDKIQITQRLTLNLGLRWDLPGMYSERGDRATVFLPQEADPLSQIVGLPLKGQLAFVNSPEYPDRHTMQSHYLLFEPRAGLAWRAFRQTVIRLGYGISHESVAMLPLNAAPSSSPINTATTTMVTSLNGGLTPANTLSNPFPNGIIEPAGRSAPFLRTFEGAAVAGAWPYEPIPYAQQWNADIQREFAGGLLLDIGYAGAKGTNLPRGTQSLNQISNQYDSLGAALLASNPNPMAGKVASSSLLNAATITTGQLLRPFPQYTSVTIGPPDIGNSIWHSLQAKLVKRWKSGGTLLATYTWAKMISDSDADHSSIEYNGIGTDQNYYNLRGDRSLTSFDAAHRLVVSYVVDLPFGKGHKWMSNAHGPLAAILSNWSVNGIAMQQSGFPIPMDAQATTLQSSFGAGTTRPNVAPGCQKSLPGSSSARINEWFNVNCYSQPGAFSFGTESRTDPNLRMDGIHNYDFSAVRTIPLSERFRLQFKAEFFNLFNHPQFASPYEVYNASTVNTSLNRFGVVTAQQNQPRLVQFAMRLTY